MYKGRKRKRNVFAMRTQWIIIKTYSLSKFKHSRHTITPVNIWLCKLLSVITLISKCFTHYKPTQLNMVLRSPLLLLRFALSLSLTWSFHLRIVIVFSFSYQREQLPFLSYYKYMKYTSLHQTSKTYKVALLYTHWVLIINIYCVASSSISIYVTHYLFIFWFFGPFSTSFFVSKFDRKVDAASIVKLMKDKWER